MCKSKFKRKYGLTLANPYNTEESQVICPVCAYQWLNFKLDKSNEEMDQLKKEIHELKTQDVDKQTLVNGVGMPL